MNSDTSRKVSHCQHAISSTNGNGEHSRNSVDDLASSQASCQHSRVAKRPLRVMKFGGTSVGDTSCISRVADIIRTSLRDSDLIIVVSAMGGVTNKLLEAASQAEIGDEDAVAEILKQLRQQHDLALKGVLQSEEEQRSIARNMANLFEEGDRLCKGTSLLKELTLRARDAISSLGERLSILLVAAALRERGVAAQAIEATDLIVTNSSHGAADPCLDLTRKSCEARLFPLLQSQGVPVVTGFIGATTEGVLTTLGRGGSDYSATILGAALGASEIVIWTDVDGLLTADPRLVRDACTISEISYREAADLAYFGAKVLHPKTLRPVVPLGIPLWIRNSFSPDKPGTKITPHGASNGSDVTALTVVSDAALITIGGPAIASVLDALSRTLAIVRELRADVLLISQSSSHNDICLVVPSSIAKRMVEELRREFAQNLVRDQVEHIHLDSSVALVSVVGKKISGMGGIIGRTFGALGRANVDTIAIAHGSSQCNLSFVVGKKDVHSALVAIHREFGLSNESSGASSEILGSRPITYQSELLSGSAD